MSEGTPEQKQLTINMLNNLADVIRRGLFTGADSISVFNALNFLQQNVALLSGPSLVAPEKKVEQ